MEKISRRPQGVPPAPRVPVRSVTVGPPLVLSGKVCVAFASTWRCSAGWATPRLGQVEVPVYPPSLPETAMKTNSEVDRAKR